MKTVYLCLDRNVIVEKPNVKVEQLGTVLCQDKNLERKIGQVNVVQLNSKRGVQVVSALKVMDCILKSYEDISIQSIGETDVIVQHSCTKPGKCSSILKTFFVGLILFFGASFSIMAFHADIGLEEMMGRLYFQVTGMKAGAVNVLNVSYSLGIFVGIVVFFNHAGKKKVTSDPTPIQVQMRSYEKDVDEVFIEETSRKGTKIDVS